MKVKVKAMLKARRPENALQWIFSLAGTNTRQVPFVALLTNYVKPFAGNTSSILVVLATSSFTYKTTSMLTYLSTCG
jgi:hypothetical protein